MNVQVISGTNKKKGITFYAMDFWFSGDRGTNNQVAAE
jgi:hypothetical protein